MRNFISVLLLILPMLSVVAQTEQPDSIAMVTSAVPVQQMDSAYLSQIDSIMQVYETMNRQKKVEEVVRKFEEARLKK